MRHFSTYHLRRLSLLAAQVAILGFPSLSEAQFYPVTVADATNSVINDVILPGGNAGTSVGFLYNTDSPDSVLLPGTPIQAWDGTLDQIVSSPSYFFWIDNHNDEYWLHPTTFALIDAFTGAITTFPADSWPIVNGLELDRFMVQGDASAEKIYGAYGGTGIAYNFANPVAHADTNRSGVIVTGKNVEGDRDETAIENDAERAKEILNTEADVDTSQIHVTGLDGDGTGSTLEEICAALDKVKGKEKLFFVYVGHGEKERPMAGLPPGIIIEDENGDKVELSYEELARKLAETGAKEVCITIIACYSGSAVSFFTDCIEVGDDVVKLKGTIITSSADDKRTKGTSDGSAFMTAFQTCLADPLADFNKDGKTTFVEASAWAVAVNPNIQSQEPQGEILGDGREIHFYPSSDSKTYKSSRAGGGTLEYFVRRYYYKIGEDAETTCRGVVYLKNTTNADYRARNAIEITCKDAKGKKTTFTLKRFVIPKKGMLCLPQTPPGCNRISGVKKAGDSSVMTVAAEIPGGASPLRSRSKIYKPGEFIFQETLLGGAPGDSFTAVVEPVAGWDLSVDPSSFLASAVIDTQVAVIQGTVPDTASMGALLEGTFVNVTTADTVIVDYRALLDDSVGTPIAGGDTKINRFVRAHAGLHIGSGTATLQGSVVAFRAPINALVDSAGTLVIRNSSFHPDSGAAYSFTARGTLDWEGVSLVEPTGGLQLNGASGSIASVAVLKSSCDGLVVRESLDDLSIDAVLVDSCASYGSVFDGVSGVVRNLAVENSGDFEVLLLNSSAVELRNSFFDSTDVSVEAGSALTRTWSTMVEVVSSSGEELAGIPVTVTDLVGDTVAVAQTRDDGGTDLLPLIQYVQTSGGITNHTPHTIHVGWAGFDTTLVHAVDEPGIASVVIPDSVAVGVHSVGPGPAFLLFQNVPNPFRSSTRITFTLPQAGRATLRVFDLRGRVVDTIVSRHLEAGLHEVDWIPKGRVARGVYFYRLQAQGLVETRKLILLSD